MNLKQENEELRKALEHCIIWLEGALECEKWKWDIDQRQIAEEAVRDGKTILGEPRSWDFVENNDIQSAYDRGWPSDQSYLSTCFRCDKNFVGPKRAPCCWNCAETRLRDQWYRHLDARAEGNGEY